MKYTKINDNKNILQFMKIRIKIEYIDNNDSTKSYTKYETVNKLEFFDLHISEFYLDTQIDYLFDYYEPDRGAIILKIIETDAKLEHFEKYVKDFLDITEEEFMENRNRQTFAFVYEKENN